MSERATFAESVYSDPKFAELVKKRRKTCVGLFSISMIMFFSIPAISSFCPDFFRARVFGSVNFGLIFLVAQYAIGGVIAWRYAAQLVHIDEQAKQLVTRLQESPLLNSGK